MRYFQDTGILLFYGLFALLYENVSLQFVFSFLCGLILICFAYFIENRWLRLAAGLILVALTWAVWPIFFFLPVAVYVFVREHQYILAGICIFGEIYYFIYSGRLSLVFLCFFCFGSLLAVLLEKRTEQYEILEVWFKESQDDSRERNFLLSEKNKALLAKQDYELYAATLRERNRIAREIHDNVGHVLSRSILLVGAMKTINQETAMSVMLDNLDDSLNSAMDSIRSSVHDLHDEAINLREAVNGLIDDFKFCPVELHYDMGTDLPKEVKYCFIGIVKEALANVMKHSNASHVDVFMREHPALYQLCIEDNGTAFSSFAVAESPEGSGINPDGPGIGLVNMQDRVRTLNGTFQVTKQHGFKIFITIPKEL